MVPPFYCLLVSLAIYLTHAFLMKLNERLYIDVKFKILSLKESKFIDQEQATFLLNKARKKLGLKVENESIYL